MRRSTALYFYYTWVNAPQLSAFRKKNEMKIQLRQDKSMRKKTGKTIRNILCTIIIGVIGLLCAPVSAKAEEVAVFHVQASEVRPDGTIRVSVYMTDTTDLGGIDAELVYDPAKVTYVSSGRGNSFTGGFGQTNCDEATSTVKCVTVYPEAKTAHGELMYAVFKLNGIESYQPEFRVIDLLDASAEIRPIPYTITYQQTDGSWTDTRDDSEKAADGNVIVQALEAYGAPEDMEGRPDKEEGPMEERIEGEGITADEASKEDAAKDEASSNSASEINDSKNKKDNSKDDTSKSKKTEETSGKRTAAPFVAVIIVSIVLVLVIAGFIVIRGRRRRNEE